jgi:hypothetical protein
LALIGVGLFCPRQAPAKSAVERIVCNASRLFIFISGR